MTGINSAIIIGGGIAGPLTALALRKAGIESTLYEAYATTAEGVGGALMMAPNGLDALRILGLDSCVCAVAQAMPRMVISDGGGARFGEFGGMPGLPPSQAVWRSDLYRVLREQTIEAGIPIEFDKRLVDAIDTPTGIIARFADGSSARGDVLIGADGIRSRVRTLIDPQAPGPEYTGVLGFGGQTSGKHDSTDADAMHFVFGKRAFLGYWTAPDGRTNWFGSLPHREPMTQRQAREIPASDWLQVLRKLYADDQPGRQLLEDTDADQLIVSGAGEMLPSIPNWHRGRKVLVGDAVHAPSSSSGQGASLAAESAIQLAQCLRDLPDMTMAFTAYEQLRRPRVEKIAAAAAKTNNKKASGPMAKAMMRVLMPIAMKTFFKPEKIFGSSHGYRIDWDEIVSSPMSQTGQK